MSSRRKASTKSRHDRSVPDSSSSQHNDVAPKVEFAVHSVDPEEADAYWAARGEVKPPRPSDAPRIVDPCEDDVMMAETDVSSTKDKAGWINGEHTDLKPTEVRVYELDELSELSDTTLELDEVNDTTLDLDELSDTNLELSELIGTEDGAGLAAGRNGHCSAQRKVHKKFNMGLFLSKFDQPFPQSISSPFSSRIPRGSQQIIHGRGLPRVLQRLVKIQLLSSTKVFSLSLCLCFLNF